MKTLTNISLCAVSLACFTLTAHAQTAQRTFVSTTGSDANTASLCSTANPCRSFTAALTVTTAGGEIITLTSGGYGPVEITKSVQITGPTGVYVAITAQPATAIGGRDAIRVNAGVSDIVVIRGLTLNNVGTANANGITFPSGQRLYVENCVINGFDNNGISVERSAAASPEVFINGTIVRNGGSIFLVAGIFLRQAAGGGSLIRATINNCQLERAGAVGLLAADNTRVTVRNTVAAHSHIGFAAAAKTGTTAQLNLEDCTATNAEAGIWVGNISPFTGGVATAHISHTASGNNVGAGIILHGTAHISDSTFNGNGSSGIVLASGGTAYISDSTVNGNAIGILVPKNATVHISDSTINGNRSTGIQLENDPTSVVFVTFTTISGNGGKGLHRSAAGSATTIGSNRIFNNTGGSDAFSATLAQQ
jgi:hypothetical protein